MKNLNNQEFSYGRHLPVMPEQILEFAAVVENSGIIIDATLGAGGHARLLLEKNREKKISYIGIDRDNEMLSIAKANLKEYSNVIYINGEYENIDKLVSGISFESQRASRFADAVIFDLGVSSVHLDNAERGFSFRYAAPLDMRLDRNSTKTASDIVNHYSEKNLAEIIYQYGEERYSRRIARYIVEYRKKKRIETTTELADIILKSYPNKSGASEKRIHPATRTFQALRIEVNGELKYLDKALISAAFILKPGGRVCVISFHSLEDRIVKNAFKLLSGKSDGFVNLNGLINEADLGNGKFNILTKKPLTAGSDEVARNPRSRSAKLRVLERVA